MVNPFYVEPASPDITPLASGLGALAERTRAEKKRKRMTEAAREALKSGDPMKMADVSLEYPEMSKGMTAAFGFTNDRTEKAAREAYRRALADPDNADMYLQQGIEEVSKYGGQPTMMNRDLELLQQNPESTMRAMKMAYAGIDPEGYKALQAEGDDGAINDPVKATNMMPGGLVQFVRKSGKVETVRPSEADSILIREAEERGAEIQGRRASAREGGKGAASIGLDAFDKVGKLRSNIGTLKEVITAVGDGAETGPLASKLPSFKAASVRLDNLQQQLGLDVIGSVTFGALSEGELDLALNKALPTGLEGPELVKWANDKIKAQEKLANYLQEQAEFLLDGGTVPDWIRHKRKQVGETPTETEGQALPDGISQELWDEMTPEERAAFQ